MGDILKTIIISQDGNCLEFNSKKKAPADKLLQIDIRTKCAAILCDTGSTIQVFSFESFDIGERIATNKKVLFLRGNTILFEFPADLEAAEHRASLELQDVFITGANGDETHEPVFNSFDG